MQGRLGILIAALLSLGAGIARSQKPDQDFFEKNVRPLLVKQCLSCHSGNQAMSGLRLDSREAIEKGGVRGPAIAANDPGHSMLIRAVRQTDPKLKMPPGGKLSEAEIAALEQWIAMGAPWGAAAPNPTSSQKFWAFVAPVDPPVPAVKNRTWVKSPIDAFMLAALEAKGLTPARPADKRSLIRRVTFDLTGLPPAPDEVQAFLNDSSPDAFAKVVDRLLASPRYGERWGRHWLDVARYADSNGLDENLVYKSAFRYRDYVIQAFNKDKPYDQFIHEQLAGDLLPEDKDLATTFERWTATGFLSLGAKMLAEDDPVKMEMDIVDEQLDTTARAFMGLTLGCARCHDHKFDPIPQADYYSMAGIFKSSKTMENFKVVATWHEYVLAPKEDRDLLKAHSEKVEAKRKEIGGITKVQNARLASEAMLKAGQYLLAAGDVMRYEKVRLKPRQERAADARAAGNFDRGNVPRTLEKGKRNVVAEQKGPFYAEYDVAVPAAGDYQVDLLEEEAGGGTADLLVNGVLMKQGAPPVQNRAASPDAGGWSVAGIFLFPAGKSIIRLEHRNRFPYFEKLLVAPSQLQQAPKTGVQVARQYGVNPGFLEQWVEELHRSGDAPNSVLYLWQQGRTEGWTSPAAALFRDLAPANREALAARYQDIFRDAVRQWEALGPEPPAAASLPDAGLEAMRQLLYEKFGPFRPPSDAKQYYPTDPREQLTRLEKEAKDLEAATPDFPRAMGVREGEKISDLPVHIRGSHWTLGPVAPRGFLHAVSSEERPIVSNRESGRLELARWLTRKDHPLTSRVMVNRIWRGHFGRGIVPSTDNFGRLGEPPTNQPLLDWLALRFIEQGWSVKAMHRTILLSNAYQMSTEHNAKAAESDPENTLLWRMNRRRLEAESIRDAILAVSGDIDLTPGGTILAYKDRQYVSNTEKRGGANYDLNRRAVYLPIIRSSMYEMFQAFDLPDPSTPTGDRMSTVVAPQALFMMNGPVLLKHTRTMADGLLARTDLDDAGRIRNAYERALGRPPEPREIDRALTLISRVSQAMADRQPDPKARLAFAWQSFCKSLVASNEFIYLN
jgi:hypothetical protein